MWGQSRRLYVAEFKTGVIKIGVTGSPGDRRRYKLQVVHGQIERMQFGQLHECGYWAERELIERMRRMGRTFKGREWFTGVHFGAAVNLMKQITRNAHAITALQAADSRPSHPAI